MSVNLYTIWIIDLMQYLCTWWHTCAQDHNISINMLAIRQRHTAYIWESLIIAISILVHLTLNLSDFIDGCIEHKVNALFFM